MATNRAAPRTNASLDLEVTSKQLEYELNAARAELEVWRRNMIPVMRAAVDGIFDVVNEITPEDSFKLALASFYSDIKEIKTMTKEMHGTLIRKQPAH